MCGYSNKKQNYGMHLSEEYVGKRNGDDEFIRISGTFLVKNTSMFNYDSHEVSLYACPECNTIQLRD